MRDASLSTESARTERIAFGRYVVYFEYTQSRVRFRQSGGVQNDYGTLSLCVFFRPVTRLLKRTPHVIV